QNWYENRPALLLRGRQRSSDLAKGLRLDARRQMVDVVPGILLLMERGNGVGDEVGIHDVDLVFGTKRQHRQSRQEYECFHHVELRRLRITAVAEHDARPENCFGYIWQKLPDHVLAEFLGAGIRIVIRPVPLDCTILGYNFILTFARDRNGTDVTESA